MAGEIHRDVIGVHGEGALTVPGQGGVDDDGAAGRRRLCPRRSRRAGRDQRDQA